jgi:AcrR family transcriptional regulator
MTPPEFRAPTGPGRPPATSRSQILAAAREVIDRDGWQKLTVRSLAGELGVGASTIYHHVRDRDELLIQLLNEQAARLVPPATPEEPRERIIVGATAIHDALVAAPWAVEVLASDDLVGEASLWMVEAIVDGAMQIGLTAEQAVDLYRSLWYFIVGEILVRSGSTRRRASDDRPAYRDEVFGRLDPEMLPRLAALAGEWPSLTRRDTFAAALQAFVNGLLGAADA